MVHWAASTCAGRLGSMARPRGGDGLDDEMRRLRDHQVDVLVSLLEAGEVHELELEREAEAASAVGMTFLAHPIEDRGLPAVPVSFHGFVKGLAAELAA